MSKSPSLASHISNDNFLSIGNYTHDTMEQVLVLAVKLYFSDKNRTAEENVELFIITFEAA